VPICAVPLLIIAEDLSKARAPCDARRQPSCGGGLKVCRRQGLLGSADRRKAMLQGQLLFLLAVR